MNKINESIPLVELIKGTIEKSDFEKIKDIEENYHESDICEALSELDVKYAIVLLKLFKTDKKAEVFSMLSQDFQKKLIENMNDKWVFDIFEKIDKDDAADIIYELPENLVKRVLSNASSNTRDKINKLLSYDEHSAGGIMSVEYVWLEDDWNISYSMTYIKKIVKSKETESLDNIFVVTKKNEYLGTIKLTDIFFSNENISVGELIKDNKVYCNTWDDQENVALKMQKYDISSIPVLDHLNKIVGVITNDDVMDVIADEGSEDVYRLAGIKIDGEDNYFTLGMLKIMWKRMYSLLLLLIISTISQVLIVVFLSKMNWINKSNEKTIDYTITLLVTPLIIVLSGICGTAGNQLSAIVIRGLSLNDIKLKDTWHILKRESYIGLLIGFIIVIFNFIRLTLFYGIEFNWKFDKFIWYTVLSVSISLLLTIFISNMLGCLLPIIVKLWKKDPAIVSGPLLTTIVDLISIVMLYGISYLLLNNIQI